MRVFGVGPVGMGPVGVWPSRYGTCRCVAQLVCGPVGVGPVGVWDQLEEA